VSAVPGLPSAEELSALPAAGLAVRLAGAYRLIAELTGQVERLTALNERLSARVDELERRARQDSSTSSRPPSSDGPHKKGKRSTDRSLRERGKRRPGKAGRAQYVLGAIGRPRVKDTADRYDPNRSRWAL
jgi:hypothetical protein